MEDIFILGTSGFAREAADIAIKVGYSPIFVARDLDDAEDVSSHGRTVGEDELEKYSGAKGAIGVGDNRLRRKLADRFGSTLTFPSLIHPDASFGTGQKETIESAEGVIVCAGVRFTNRIHIGKFGIYNLNCTIGHDVIVGDFCNIAPGANVSGYVKLHSGVWLGTGCAINQGDAGAHLEIGSNSVIGSGSVVVKSCEPDSVYVGIPAKKR